MNLPFKQLRYRVVKFLRSNINTILPIALALVLPGLSIYANIGLYDTTTIGVTGVWLLTSCVLYLYWWVLWLLWDTNSKSKRWWFVLALILFIIAISFTTNLLDVQNDAENKWFNILRLILASVLILAIQFALKAQENIAKLRLEKEQIQTENYRAQLKALRAQIDPHFLFNSLNTLRSMVRQRHDNSEQFIMSLSQFYRQSLKHNDNTTLLLSQELSVLESYLFLMKSRNEEAVYIDWQIDQALLAYQIPTLALQIVVENCFKHNSMTSKNPLQILVQSIEGQYIQVSNSIQPKIGDKESSGYGLDSLRKRYELLGISDGILVEENPDQFIVKLKLLKK